MDEESRYEIILSLNKVEARAFHSAIKRAYETWPGGHPLEQEILEELKLRSWVCLMNLVLEDSD